MADEPHRIRGTALLLPGLFGHDGPEDAGAERRSGQPETGLCGKNGDHIEWVFGLAV